MTFNNVFDFGSLKFAAFLMGAAEIRHIYGDAPKPNRPHHRKLRRLMRQPFLPAAAALRREYRSGMDVERYRLMG